MIKYIAKKTMYGLLVLIGVIILVFFLFQGIGDPARMVAGQSSDSTTQSNIRKELYLINEKGEKISRFKQFLYYLNDVSPICFHSKADIEKKKLKGFFIGGNTKFGFKVPYLRTSYQSKRSVWTILMKALMKVHLKFTAYGMKNMDAYLAIYFTYNDDISGVLKDKNDKFVSTAGDVALYRNIKPGYDPAVYDDLSTFMPYSELDLEPGNYDLTMDIKLIYKTGGEIAKLTYYDFEYSKPGSPADVESESKVDVIFEDLWIDYDVTENGKKGMKIHVKFTINNMKAVDAYVAVYFEQKNGESIEGISTEYRSKNGQLAVYKSLKPAYAEAVYKDVALFMPYSEINVSKGKHDLKLDADIILKNGDMVKHLKDHEFWYSK